MSIEVNSEKLSSLSIADLWALNKFAKMFRDEFCYSLSEEDKYNDIIHYTKEEINKRTEDIFIF